MRLIIYGMEQEIFDFNENLNKDIFTYSVYKKISKKN